MSKEFTFLIHYRCQYKLLIYVYKAQHGKAPSYLQELITPYKPNRALWSENSMLLHRLNDVRTVFCTRCSLVMMLLVPYNNVLT
jgi:hypothetical protein